MIRWRQVALQRCADNADEPAEIVRELTPGDIGAAEDVWYPALIALLHPLLQVGTPRSDLPEHKHWEWQRKAQRFYGAAGYEFWGTQAAGEMQGMMLANVNEVCRTPVQAGAPLAYVDYLATAPWNLRALTPTPKLRGVGRLLLEAAVGMSRESGFAGRIGLHALPQAESFYRDMCGMTDMGEDPNEYDLRYFEMTEAQATVSHPSKT